MLNKIAFVDNSTVEFSFLSSSVIDKFQNNSFLQMINISINELDIYLANSLLNYEHIYTIVLRVREYRDGFFAALLKNTKERPLRFLKVCYFNYDRENCNNEMIFSNFDDMGNMEEIIKHISEQDVEAIIKAREEEVHVEICFYTSSFRKKQRLSNGTL
ncbi:hypothetical protein PAEPH01_1838 [Pancytospora epiphaga]|nr:hypothetical protein PAEPH01_1838 [Pancytospora epiphaga]